MRRLTIGFTVVVLVLLFASVASAVPPGFCDGDRVHPACPPPDPSSTTTTEPTTTTTAPPLPACPTGTFTIEGIRRTTFECLWSPVNNGSEVGTVTIYNPPEGGIPRPPTLFVRDDGPGDICIFEYQWETQNGPEYVESFNLFYDEVPEPTPSDPDVLDYSPWLGNSYWDFIRQDGMEPGTHWCAPQDFVLDGIREDNNGGALTLTVMFDAKRGGSLDITLFPENSP